MTPCCLVSPLAHAHGFDSFAERKEESRSVGHALADATMLFCSLIRNNDRFPVGQVRESARYSVQWDIPGQERSKNDVDAGF